MAISLQMGVVIITTAIIAINVTIVIVITITFTIVIVMTVLVLQMGEIVGERPAVDNCQPGLTSRYHQHFAIAIFIIIPIATRVVIKMMPTGLNLSRFHQHFATLSSSS